MGTKAEAKVRRVLVTAGEALALQLAEHASAAAGAAVRALGYARPSAEQWRRIGAAIGAEAVAAGLLIREHMPDVTDDALDQAAELTGLAAVREVLGPPPMAH